MNAFSGDIIDINNFVVGNGIIYCSEHFLSVRGVCWLEYNFYAIEGYSGPSTIVAFGSLPAQQGSPISLTVTGIRGSLLTSNNSALSIGSGLVELLLYTEDGSPDSSQFFTTMKIM